MAAIHETMAALCSNFYRWSRRTAWLIGEPDTTCIGCNILTYNDSNEHFFTEPVPWLMAALK